MEHLEYEIEDHTIALVLGVQNFTNEESAVLELVKNSFDAQAKTVNICISENRIVVDDDGIGMNRQIILDYWMYVGKSDKPYQIGENEDKRIVAGEKGIGRFALARLGKKVTLYSRMVHDTTGVVWSTDWSVNTLDSSKNIRGHGTKIVIDDLRDYWTMDRVRNLREFLSRTYNSDSMEINLKYNDEEIKIKKYFEDFQLGIHSVSQIQLYFEAKTRILHCTVESDEFKEDAKEWCGNLNFQHMEKCLNMADELEGMQETLTQRKRSGEEWKHMLTSIGDFSAVFYFSLENPSAVDADKYYYKHNMLENRYEHGIILYRNAFSISSYEGKKDWLGLGKRSYMSAASAAHETGSWRVKESQLSGKVMIDKRENCLLTDLANRQGLLENDAYKIFIQIILSGIQWFERYRQTIIRLINEKNEKGNESVTKIYEIVTKEPHKLEKFTPKERELIQKFKEEDQRKREEIEKKYQYEIRLLNTLATSGLKASSIAHEMRNYRNSIDDNVDDIICALKKYGLWEKVNAPENKKYIFENIPELLEKNRKVNMKIASFIDVMLSEVEREQFMPENIMIKELFQDVKAKWEKDYSWIEIKLEMEDKVQYKSAKDIFVVIFDNLILNSVQQNEDKNSLHIVIKAKKMDSYMDFIYSDNGQGLVPKYRNDPRRILEVHETSRKGGHGIGMWIVNNTVTRTKGSIIEIDGTDGFKIRFRIGEGI